MKHYDPKDPRTETEMMLEQYSDEELEQMYRSDSPRMIRVYAYNILRQRGIELEWILPSGDAHDVQRV